MRGHGNDTRARYRRRYFGDTVVGMGRVTCSACGSDQVYEAGAKPERCSMCGTELHTIIVQSTAVFTRPREVGGYQKRRVNYMTGIILRMRHRPSD